MTGFNFCLAHFFPLFFWLLSSLHSCVNFLEGVGLRDFKFAYGGAAEGFEMSTCTEELAHFVGHRTHVGAGGYAGAEAGAVAFDGEDNEFLNFDLDRLENYLFLFSCQLVGRDAVDFLGGEWWRDLLDYAQEPGG